SQAKGSITTRSRRKAYRLSPTAPHHCSSPRTMPSAHQPTVELHLDVAGRFLVSAEEASKAAGDLRSWSIVVAFYAGVHWVRAFIRWKEPTAQITSHDDVKGWFERFPELVRVRAQYDTLKQMSHGIRYYGELTRSEKDYADALRMARNIR